MNPWKANILHACRDILGVMPRFGAVSNALMFAVFATLVFYQFWTDAWDWMLRKRFNSSCKKLLIVATEKPTAINRS